MTKRVSVMQLLLLRRDVGTYATILSQLGVGGFGSPRSDDTPLVKTACISTALWVYNT